MTWVDDPAKWDKLADRLRAAGEFGFDTETYDQPDGTSPAHRARVHCWSVGVLHGVAGPRGHRGAVGVVMPAGALLYGPLRDVLEDPGVRKWAHNAPHDYHSTRNMGVEIRGLVDTLQWARVACPGRQAYGLKAAEQWALGLPPRAEFLDLVKYTAVELKAKRHREKGCVCGDKPCRKRTAGHCRVSWRRFVPEPRNVEKRYAVTDFVPGHPRWAEWLTYSLTDAVRGMMLADWLRNLKPKEAPWPWIRHSDDST